MVRSLSVPILWVNTVMLEVYSPRNSKLSLPVELDGVLIITLQPLYNTVHYNTVLDITRFKDGSQKCIDYIEK